MPICVDLYVVGCVRFQRISFQRSICAGVLPVKFPKAGMALPGAAFLVVCVCSHVLVR